MSQSLHDIFECGTELPEEIVEENPFYMGTDQSCYFPTSPCNTSTFPYSAVWSQMDTVVVRLNFHFIRTGDVGLNFGADDGNCPSCANNEVMTMYKVADDFVSWLNNEAAGMADYTRYKDENGNSIPGEPFLDAEGHPVPNLGDTKIRYELYEENDQGSVHYHHVESDYKWFVSGTSVPLACRDGQITKRASALNDEFSVYGDKVLDVFIFDEWFENETENGQTCRLQRGAAGLGEGYLSIGNLWHYWQENGGNYSLWNYMSLLNHEIGHCLNLGHTFPFSSCCDATEPSFWDYSNNTMGYNHHGEFVFSPCQMDRIFNFFYNNSPEWVVLDNNQNVNPPPPEPLTPEIVIDDPNGETWDEDMEIYKHVRVKSGSQLNILNSSIGLAPDVRIHVEQGAKLYVLNSTLTLLCNINESAFLRWEGIRVEGNPERAHPNHWNDPFNPDGLDPGRVVLLGSNVEYANTGITAFSVDFITSPFQFVLKSSGYVYSDQSSFVSCDVGIVFYTYQHNNNSKILNTTFKDFGFGIEQFKPEIGIVLHRNHGLEIQGSNFENINQIGIYAMDSGFEAFNGCVFSNIGGEAISALSSTGYVPSTLSIKIGKEGTSFKNQFHNNLLDIRLEGYSNLLDQISIKNNIFADTWNSSDPGSNQSKGIEVKETPVLIAKNEFLDKYHSISFTPFLRQSHVNNNNLLNFHTGIWYKPGSAHHSHFLCNKFLQNHNSGVYLESSSINSQGSVAEGYGNEWERGENFTPSSTIADIRTNTFLSRYGVSSIFNYYVEETIPVIHPYRPLCNLTYSPQGCFTLAPYDYEVPDAQSTTGLCESINPFEEHEPKSIPQLRTEMIQIAQQDSLYTYNLDYSKRAAVKYQKVIAKVDSLVHLNQLQQAENVLIQEPEDDYFYLRVGLYIHKGEYQTAKSILDGEIPSSEEVSDYREVQLINIERLTDYEFELDSMDRETLEIIADKRSTPATYARAILSLVDKRSWDPLFPQDSSGTEQQRIIGDTESENIISTEVFPNPSKGIFNIVPGSLFEESDELEFQIHSVMGSKIMSGSFPARTEVFEIDLQEKPTGTYILTLHNTRDHRESLIIQKH